MIKFQFSIVSWTGARAGSLPLSSEIETERRLRFAMIAGLQSFIHCYTILIVVEICSTDVAVHPVLCDLYIANSLISTLAIDYRKTVDFYYGKSNFSICYIKKTLRGKGVMCCFFSLLLDLKNQEKVEKSKVYCITQTMLCHNFLHN